MQRCDVIQLEPTRERHQLAAACAMRISAPYAKACGLDTCVAEQIVESLKQNSPKELGEKAMGQGITLSRPKPDGDGAMSEKDREKYIEETAAKINASRGFKN